CLPVRRPCLSDSLAHDSPSRRTKDEIMPVAGSLDAHALRRDRARARSPRPAGPGLPLGPGSGSGRPRDYCRVPWLELVRLSSSRCRRLTSFPLTTWVASIGRVTDEPVACDGCTYWPPTP